VVTIKTVDGSKFRPMETTTTKRFADPVALGKVWLHVVGVDVITADTARFLPHDVLELQVKLRLHKPKKTCLGDRRCKEVVS